MSGWSGTQFLDSRHRAVNGMLRDPQFFGSPPAGRVELFA
jgi:hypothetical protein